MMKRLFLGSLTRLFLVAYLALLFYAGTKSTASFYGVKPHVAGVITTVGLPMKITLYEDIVFEEKALPASLQGFVLFAPGNVVPLLVDFGVLVLVVELGLLGFHRLRGWLRAPLRKPLLR